MMAFHVVWATPILYRDCVNSSLCSPWPQDVGVSSGAGLRGSGQRQTHAFAAKKGSENLLLFVC